MENVCQSVSHHNLMCQLEFDPHSCSFSAAKADQRSDSLVFKDLDYQSLNKLDPALTVLHGLWRECLFPQRPRAVLHFVECCKVLKNVTVSRCLEIHVTVLYPKSHSKPQTSFLPLKLLLCLSKTTDSVSNSDAASVRMCFCPNFTLPYRVMASREPTFPWRP